LTDLIFRKCIDGTLRRISELELNVINLNEEATMAKKPAKKKTTKKTTKKKSNKK